MGKNRERTYFRVADKRPRFSSCMRNVGVARRLDGVQKQGRYSPFPFVLQSFRRGSNFLLQRGLVLVLRRSLFSALLNRYALCLRKRLRPFCLCLRAEFFVCHLAVFLFTSLK